MSEHEFGPWGKEKERRKKKGRKNLQSGTARKIFDLLLDFLSLSH